MPFYNAPMRIVGLTGRIGTGKSTVSRWLEPYGVLAVDSDALVRELYASDAALQVRLAERFGAAVVQDGSVHRPTLGAAVFGNPAALADLEQLVHPAVQRLRDVKLEAARVQGAPAVIVEAIKLVESGGSAICDELWIVVAAEHVQLQRLAGRGVPEPEARRRLAAQGTVQSWSGLFLAESLRLSRPRPIVVFDNSGTEEAGRAQAERLWRGAASDPGGVPLA